MPVGKESIKRAASATTKKRTTARKAAPAAEEKVQVQTVKAPEEEKPVVNEKAAKTNPYRPIRIFEELPFYLL